MEKHFLIITNKNIFNRQFIYIAKKNFECEINKEDLIYVSENGTIQTMWRLYEKSKENYKFEKIKVIREGCNYIDLATSKNNEKKVIHIDNKEDIQYITQVFEHKIKIYPQYNINNILDKDIELINSLKRYDPKIEFYYNVITDNSQKSSIAIIPTYGVCVIENYEEKSLGNINSNIDSILEKLKQNKNLYKDMQLFEIKSSIALNNDKNELNINYTKYMLCNTLTEKQINEINELLKEKINYIKFVTMDTLMNELVDISNKGEIIIDKPKEYGIKCALMPQYVIRKKSITFIKKDDVIKIPQSSIELDDEQIRILDELNERTYIEATAGTGKSVLLLTKAYMMAKENIDKQFLLLCYNNKLCEELDNEAKYKNLQL